uniref:Uncharacterized protein n=1 Tax=viral metagenome TaxID=1070528 RepID=A0A6H1ZP82_9ZZZZ
MGGRSIRNKIMYNLEQAARNMDKAMISLKKAHDVSLGGHPRLESLLPPLVEGLDEYKKLFLRLREEI